MSIESEVIEFIREETSVSKRLNLTSKTDLRSDLRIMREDAEDILWEFFKKFSIKIGDFSFDDYFPPDHGNVFSINFWLGREIKPKKLTIGMMVKSVEDGAWNTAEIERYCGVV